VSRGNRIPVADPSIWAVDSDLSATGVPCIALRRPLCSCLGIVAGACSVRAVALRNPTVSSLYHVIVSQLNLLRFDARFGLKHRRPTFRHWHPRELPTIQLAQPRSVMSVFFKTGRGRAERPPRHPLAKVAPRTAGSLLRPGPEFRGCSSAFGRLRFQTSASELPRCNASGRSARDRKLGD
jgi:hypothetical protein